VDTCIEIAGEEATDFSGRAASCTTRHNQAAVHTTWSPGNETVFFAFRKMKWGCVAASDEKSRGHVRLQNFSLSMAFAAEWETALKSVQGT
jgi:hypothetical protein